MSSGITAIDRIESLTQEWHGAADIKSPADWNLSNCWLSRFNVEKRPLYRSINGAFIPTETCELFCTDDPRIVVGKPINCESYGLIDNSVFLRMVSEALLSIKGAKLASVGSVCGRNKVFVSVSLPDSVLSIAGNEHKLFLSFGNGFDLQSVLYVCASGVKTVCANTDRMNLMIAKGDKSAPVNLTIRHTKNAVDRIENVSEIIDGFYGAAALYRATIERLSEQKVSEGTARNYFAGLLANGKREEISTRRLNQVNRLTELFSVGAGNRGESRADCYGAITDYATHESSGGRDNPWKQVATSEFGAGNELKRRALATLDSSEFPSLVAIGEGNLATVN